MVLAGALLGYQLRDLVRLGGRSLIASAAVLAALTWHLPPLLSWAERRPVTHAFAHLTLLAAGGALGWAVPRLGGAARAYLFIGVNVVMWPLVLAELAGAFSYEGYSGQAAGAGLAELVAMSASWLVILLWSRVHRLVAARPAPVLAQVLLAGLALGGWASAHLPR